MNIGVISDTHGFLDKRIASIFKGVDHILHAGDIGLPWLILELEQIAPVTAVLGNNDMGLPYRETEVVDLGMHKFLVHHIVFPPSPRREIQERISIEKPHVVVFGHTHQQYCQKAGSVLFFNPGYSGAPKSNAARSVAILHCAGPEIRPEFFEL